MAVGGAINVQYSIALDAYSYISLQHQQQSIQKIKI